MVPRRSTLSPFFAKAALVLLIAWTLCSTALDDGWVRAYESNGQFFSGVARVHLEKGLGFTKGQDWIYNEDNPYDWRGDVAGEARAYCHHPPLLGLSIAAAFAVFGQEPRVARSATIAAHLVALLLLMVAVRRWTPDLPSAWFFTGLTAALTPMSIFFGRNVCHEAWVTPWLMIGVIAYLRRIERGSEGSRREDGVICAAISVASLYDWPGLYLPPILIVGEALHGRLLGRSSRWFAATTLLMILLLAGQIAWSQPDGGLAILLFGAAGRAAPGSFGYGVKDWSAAVLRSATRGSTWPLLVVTAVVAATWLRRALTTGHLGGPLAGFLTIWAALATMHVVAFPSGAWAHPYWLWYFLPAVSGATGLAAATLWDRGGGRRALLQRAVVVLVLLVSVWQARETLREWFDVDHHPTGSVVLDWRPWTGAPQSNPNDDATGGAIEVDVRRTRPLVVDSARAADDESIVVFDTEVRDRGCPAPGMHDPSNPRRLSVCTTGTYAISAQARWQPNERGGRRLAIRLLDDSTGRRLVSTRAPGDQASVQVLATRFRLAAGQHLAVVVWQDSGAPLELRSVEFSMVKLDSHDAPGLEGAPPKDAVPE
jgi:hypothetical protein